MMKTPGVYIVEKNAFPSSIVEVATAVPAFIGYTEKADNKGKTLASTPWRISSMAEYMSYFGAGPTPEFTFAEAPADSKEPTLGLGGKQYLLNQSKGKYLLFYSMLLFFQNGGGACYVVSVGTYSDDVDPDKLTAGVDLLQKEQEPTMVVIPDTMVLKQTDAIKVQQHVLDHCGNVMKNRVGILDLSDGYRSRQDPAGDPVNAFRNALGTNFLDFAMAYYPWVRTSITQAKDLAYWNLDSAGQSLLQGMLKAELGLEAMAANKDTADKAAALQAIVDGIAKTDASPQDKTLLNKNLIALSPQYNTLLGELANSLNLLPPSAAMAGVYTMVDNNRGVWKAPANVSLNSVIAPAVAITHAEQEDLNVTPQGKSINAIRAFIGEGTLVWGARTLDGNSLDWRYINVRRTMIMLEESVKLASKAYVFEPNVANTWVTIKGMISNFLNGIWKRGGLAGAVPEDAFAVFCGLGETMTPNDILEGIMRVTVLVAISRPAEFIEITFQQQMQKS
ncbi:MAG TPA: phage tail sheath C-terminal domain-containing protein [Burkholderiaceae bacterium]